MVELRINSEEELSLVNMKKLQKELNCSAFCLTTVTYDFKLEGSSVDDNIYETAEAKKTKATYHPIFEPLKIIEPSLFVWEIGCTSFSSV